MIQLSHDGIWRYCFQRTTDCQILKTTTYGPRYDDWYVCLFRDWESLTTMEVPMSGRIFIKIRNGMGWDYVWESIDTILKWFPAVLRVLLCIITYALVEFRKIVFTRSKLSSELHVYKGSLEQPVDKVVTCSQHWHGVHTAFHCCPKF